MTRRAVVGRRNTTVCVTPMMLLETVAPQRMHHHHHQNTHESPPAQSSRGVLKRGSRLVYPTGFKFSQIQKLISLPPPFLPLCVCVWLPKPTYHPATSDCQCSIRGRRIALTVSSSLTDMSKAHPPSCLSHALHASSIKGLGVIYNLEAAEQVESLSSKWRDRRQETQLLLSKRWGKCV